MIKARSMQPYYYSGTSQSVLISFYQRHNNAAKCFHCLKNNISYVSVLNIDIIILRQFQVQIQYNSHMSSGYSC